MNKKACPDFSHPCIEEYCISYVPVLVYPIFNIEIMKKLCEGSNINVNNLNMPCQLNIETGYCKKYNCRTDNCEIVNEIEKIEFELNLNSNEVFMEEENI